MKPGDGVHSAHTVYFKQATLAMIKIDLGSSVGRSYHFICLKSINTQDVIVRQDNK